MSINIFWMSWVKKNNFDVRNLSVRIRSVTDSETVDKPLCPAGASFLIWKTWNLGWTVQCFLLVAKQPIEAHVTWPRWLSDSASLSPYLHSALPATLDSLLFLEHVGPTSGPLHGLFLLPGTVFLQTSSWLTPLPPSGLHTNITFSRRLPSHPA